MVRVVVSCKLNLALVLVNVIAIFTVLLVIVCIDGKLV